MKFATLDLVLLIIVLSGSQLIKNDFAGAVKETYISFRTT